MLRELRSPIPIAVLPGESLVSFLGRWFFATGLPSSRLFVQAIAGEGRRRLSPGLPSRLDWVVRHVDAFRSHSAEDMVSQFTFAPLYRPFLEPATWLAVKYQLATGSNRDARMLLGLARGGGETRALLHCSECIGAQISGFGLPYWRHEFALPYVTVCPVHRRELKPSKANTNLRLGPHTLLAPPPAAPQLEPSVITSADASITSAAYRLSKLVCDLQAAAPLPLSRELLAQTYRTRLAEIGLANFGGRVERNELYKRLGQRWGTHGALSCCSGRDVPAWLPSLYADGKVAIRSPLQHLLLIGFLFEDVHSWKEAISKTVDGMSCILSQTPVVVENGPLVGTQRVRLEPWVSLPSRKCLGRALNTRAIELLREGLPVRTISSLTGDSVASLYRGLHRNPQLAKEWALAAFAERAALAKRTSNASPSADSHNVASRTAAKKWLYRHRRTFVAVGSSPKRAEHENR